MKKILFAILIATAFVACDKKENTTPVTNNPTPSDSTSKEDTSYIINGLSDISIGGNDDVTVPIVINYAAGKQEKITLSVSGLPKGVSVSFDPESGIPSFGSMMHVKTTLVYGGTYPIKLTGTSATGKTKTYEINLKVKDDIKCGDVIYAAAQGNNTLVVTDATSGMKIWESNMMYGGDNQLKVGLLMCEYVAAPYHYFVAYQQGEVLKLDLNCSANTVTIPQQNIYAFWYSGGNVDKTYSVTGTGKIDVAAKKMTIDYTAKDQSGNSFKYKMSIDLPGL